MRELVLACSEHPCRRISISHRLLRQDGIYLNGAWYCSPECFEGALLRVLATAAVQHCALRPARPGRTPFRLILLERGVLSEAQLRETLRRRDAGEGKLEALLLEQGLASEEQIASAKAAEASCPFYAQPPAELPAEARMPRQLMVRYAAAPLHAAADRLLVGFTRRLEPALLQAVAELTGSRVEACFITESRLQTQVAESAVLCDAGGFPDSVPDASRRTVRRAIETGAERVRVAAGDGWAWVRLTGDGVCDLLFSFDRDAEERGEQPAGKNLPAH